MIYQKISKAADDSIPFFAVVQNNGTIPSAAGNMFWADTKEKIYSFTIMRFIVILKYF
jgi:hypothetical protein